MGEVIWGADFKKREKPPKITSFEQLAAWVYDKNILPDTAPSEMIPYHTDTDKTPA